MLAAAEAVVCAILGGGAWAVAPDYDLSSIVFEQAVQFATQGPLVSQVVGEPRLARGRQMIVFKSGGWILGKSSHKPRSLLGRGLDLVIFDEAATEENEEVLHQYIRPVLVDRQGHLLPISTPRGDNWFKFLFDLGQDPEKKLYKSWQMPTIASGLYTTQEIAQLAQDYPEIFYKQEFLAEFLENMGALFRGYRAVSTLTKMEITDPSLGFAIGVDIAKHEDYTVICVIEIATGREVYLERFNDLDWPVIEERIARVFERFNDEGAAYALVDSTGVGDRSFRALEDLVTIPMDPIKFDNRIKTNMINQLQIGIQDREMRFLGKDVLAHDSDFPLGQYAMGEMSRYRYEKTLSGRITMNAPPGKHDDVVIARALAWECCLRYGGSLPRSPQKERSADDGSEVTSLAETFGTGGVHGFSEAQLKNFEAKAGLRRQFGGGSRRRKR